MDPRIVSWARVLAILIAILGLSWLAHAYRIDEHLIVFVTPRKRAVLDIPKPAPVTTATPVAMVAPSTDEQVLNEYWLSRINELRKQKQLLLLTFDSRLAATAKIWADQMGSTGVLGHDRSDGKTMHQWIEAYHLPFTERGPEGWNGNYFTENIGRAYADNTIESMKKGLDQVLTFMVDEGPEGAHYRTIFSPDWNTYGGGFYFVPVSEGRIQIYMAFHYASLQ